MRTFDANMQMKLITVLAMGALLIMFAVAGFTILDGRKTTVEYAQRQLNTLNILLGEETYRAIEGVKIAVDAVATDLTMRDIGGQEDVKENDARDEALKNQLRRIEFVLPQLDAIYVVDHIGDIIGSLSSAGISKNVSNLDAFKDMKDGVSVDRVAVGKDPLQESESIMIASRVGDGEKFRGAVIGMMHLSQFSALYQSLGVVEGSEIALWKGDGSLLVKYPRDARHTDVLESKTLEGIDKVAGVFNSESRSSNKQMVVASHVKGADLAISTAVDMDTVLVQWWRSVLFSGASCVFLALLTGMLISAVGRQFAAVAEKEAALEDRTEIEKQLHQSQKLEVIGQLTAGIAHDFNNLLTIVQGNLEMATRKLGANAEQFGVANALASSMAGAKKAAVLTHRMLAFAKKQPLAPASINVKELVKNIEEMIKRTLGDTIDVVVKVSGDVWHVYADASQLENALVNLAVNSRDAMPNGGTLTIEVENVAKRKKGTSPSGDFVAISVADNGAGMSKETLAKAFEPFFTTKEVGKGSGLGLSQIYGFAQQSGGDVKIESREGYGTKVVVYLPRSHEECELKGDKSEVEIVKGSGQSILVVEDNPELREYIVRMLRDMNYQVSMAGSAAEAFEVVSKKKVDLLLSDISLPGMEGPEIAAECRRRVKNLKVVLMSGYSDRISEVREKSDVSGRFIEKPFSQGEISQMIAMELKL